MKKRATQSFTLKFHTAKAAHQSLGYEVELFVPTNATHRQAVQDFLNGQYYEQFSHLAFKKILDHKGNNNVVHAGAFFGDMFHTLSKSAETVYAFEPVLANFILSKLNIEKLGLRNIMLVNAGLGNANSIMSIQTENPDGTILGGASRVLEHRAAERKGIEIAPVFRLDDFPIENVSLLQLDVEEFELNALNGAKGLIKNERPIILIEDNKNNCAPLLLSLNYSKCFTRSGLTYYANDEDKEFVLSLKDLKINS